MITLNARQAGYLEHKLVQARRARDMALERITGKAETPGEVAYGMAWNMESLMVSDLEWQLAFEIQGALGEEKATLENMREHFLQEIMRWTPGRSTGAGHNLKDDCKLLALKETLKLVTMLIAMGKEE